MTVPAQPGILESVPAVARHLFFSAADETSDRRTVAEALQRLAAVADGDAVAVGLGPSLIAKLEASVPGLKDFEPISGPGVQVPATPVQLWCWLRGSDPGDLLHLTRRIQKALAPAFRLRDVVDAFRHALGPSGHGKDLMGYEDGTENPTGEAAAAAALVSGQGPGLDGSSYVAIQQWVHDFDAFEALPTTEQDRHFGRRRSDNAELEDAPAWAHVNRTAQESFDPPAFVLRRSMPWMTGSQAGLLFVAFGKSHAAFEAQMRRMAGEEDGVTDALFRISRPVTGAYLWCPPIQGGRLDLRQLGL
jgi:porphyrinogen peroxidase